MNFMRYDSPVTAGINKVVDILWLSTLWFVCCIPIVTVGAATTALYYTSVKSLRRNREYIAKTFFHSFRLNLIPATLLWIVFLAGAGLLWCGFLMTGAISDEGLRFFMSCVYLFLSVIVLGTGCYAFPVLSRCTIKTFANLQFSAGLMVKHFPSTLVMMGIVIVCLAVMWQIPLFVFCLPAAGSLFYSCLMEKILIRYTPETSSDVWYMERQ